MMRTRGISSLKLGIVALMSLVFSAACSSVTLSVNSVPEKAKVFVRPVGGGEGVQVGMTPLVLTREQLKAADSASGPIIVEVQKDTFKTERVLVTEAAAVDMKLNFALQLKDPDEGMKGPGSTLADAQSLNIAIDRLFEVRKFISLESYNEALNHLRTIETTWPYLSATYEMKAGIFFLQRKYKDALAAYALAMKYNPNSVSSAEMVESLEKQLGVKADDLVREYEFRRSPAAARRAGSQRKIVPSDKSNTSKEGDTAQPRADQSPTMRRPVPRRRPPAESAPARDAAGEGSGE